MLDDTEVKTKHEDSINQGGDPRSSRMEWQFVRGGVFKEQVSLKPCCIHWGGRATRPTFLHPHDCEYIIKGASLGERVRCSTSLSHPQTLKQFFERPTPTPPSHYPAASAMCNDHAQ